MISIILQNHILYVIAGIASATIFINIALSGIDINQDH